MLDRWRVLDWYDVADSKALAIKLLSELPEGSVRDQLKSRRIKVLKLDWIRAKAFLHLASGGDGFQVTLSEDDCLAEWIFSLGHEIGHTLGFQLYLPIRCIWPRDGLIADPEEEVFCDRFAERWLARGDNHWECAELLKNLNRNNTTIMIE